MPTWISSDNRRYWFSRISNRVFEPANTKKNFCHYCIKSSYYSVDRKLRKIKQPVVTIVFARLRTTIRHIITVEKIADHIDRWWPEMIETTGAESDRSLMTKVQKSNRRHLLKLLFWSAFHPWTQTQITQKLLVNILCLILQRGSEKNDLLKWFTVEKGGVHIWKKQNFVSPQYTP